MQGGRGWTRRVARVCDLQQSRAVGKWYGLYGGRPWLIRGKLGVGERSPKGGGYGDAEYDTTH